MRYNYVNEPPESRKACLQGAVAQFACGLLKRLSAGSSSIKRGVEGGPGGGGGGKGGWGGGGGG